MLPTRIKLVNGKIIMPHRILEGGALLITGTTITAIAERDTAFDGATEIDVQGNYISPGFIDIHVHGGGGYDFMDGTEEAFLKIAETHARYGTTAMLPTTLTSERDGLIQTLESYEKANRNNNKGAQFIGMHLEGPYFALNQRGAQDPKYIRDPDPEEYHNILERFSCIKRWSAAPELPGALEFGRFVTSKGVLAAIAHTDAIYEDVVAAFEIGYRLATHLYSAMSGVTRRNAFRFAGVIESAYIIDEMDVEIIADGVHLPPPLLTLVHKIKGPDRTALITDAMRAAGMPEGESVLGNLETGLKVIVEDGVAKLPDRTSFAGSVATADRLVRTMLLTGIPLIETIRMITTTPARIMNISHTKGSISPGKDADIIVFDKHINVKKTIVKGNIVFESA